MLFNSVDYLIFLPVVILLYFVFPKKYRYIWLLAASYFFYMNWNAVYGLLLAGSTLVTYLCGLLLGRIGERIPEEDKAKRLKNLTVAVSLLLNFGALFYFKYTGFAADLLTGVCGRIGITLGLPEFDILLPVGISFFTFQAVGYTIDVYRGQIEPEKNPLRYALFVAFFPQLVAGPIERSGNLLVALRTPTDFDLDHARRGLLTISYGLFLKIVIADRISAMIDPLFKSAETYSGTALALAVVLFGFQIYCDFEGYTRIAIGSARILGYNLRENFDAPYLGLSVRDFWKRWHMSLTGWFRDYLYFPLGGSHKGKLRKYINTMIVFLVSGLWHGAGLHYVAWGGLNGALSVLDDMTGGIRQKVTTALHIDTQRNAYKWLCRIVTFVLIDFTWLFFRAESLGVGMEILKRILTDFRISFLLTLEFTTIMTNASGWLILIVSMIIMSVIDSARASGRDVAGAVIRQQVVIRWILYFLIVTILFVWGHFGSDYANAQFIYFQF